MKTTKRAFHEQVADDLIKQLKQGTAPWQKPWKPGDPLLTLPNNPTTGKRYRGINTVNLMSKGRSDPRWMTYKQATSLGAQVIKGEKGTQVQYWKFTEEHTKIDENGKPVLDNDGKQIKQQVKLERPRAFYATVFNAEQLDNLPKLEIKAPDWEPIARAEQILQASNAVIKHGQNDKAFYRSSTDEIHLPHKEQFQQPDQYYATALHELGHWTGHESRLNRDLGNPFGSEAYAKEELRAEIASMIIGSELGIGHDPEQHAAYVGSWIKVLEDDPKEIFRATADAEKIQDYVMSLTQTQTQTQEQTQTQTESLLPDLATVTAQNTKTFKSLLESMTPNEVNAINLMADARKYYRNGNIEQQDFEEVAKDKMDVNIPADWNGRINVQDQSTDTNEKAESWAVYAQRDDKLFILLKSFNTEQEAEQLADQLKLIDAAAERNEYEKAIKFASVLEERVRQDPLSTEQDISLAEEDRKLAEGVAMQKEQELRSQLDMKNKQSDEVDQNIPDQKTNKKNDVTTRQYLAVPYAEKDQAKAAGANWDNNKKSWFVGENADMQALQRWMPENVSNQQAPTMEPRAEFTELLRTNGCIVDGNHPVMDGTKQRIKVEGDKPTEKSGFYVGHLDGNPAGYFKNNRTGVEARWKAKGYTLNDGQKAELSAQAAINQQNRKVVQHESQLKVADHIKQLLAIAPSANAEHPYLLEKNARPGDLKVVPENADALPKDSIIKIGKDWQESKALRESNPKSIVLTAGDLLLPAQDINGDTWSVQTIQPSGAKFFATGSKKESNFNVVDSNNQGVAALDTAAAIVMAEGYTTADTLSKALNQPVVAAFDSGNLPKVAQALHEKYPQKQIFIAGDDDRSQEAFNGKNPGKYKALEAATLVNGTAIFPIFAPNEQVEQKLSDFNDLAIKSTFGIEAVKRQVGSAIKKTSEKLRDEKQQNLTKKSQQEIKKKKVLTR